MFPALKNRLQVNVNSLLHGGLLTFLLVGYVALVYVAVVGMGAMAQGAIPDQDFGPAWWLDVLALAIVAATFLPVARVLYRRTHELVYAEHDDPFGAIARIAGRLQIVVDPADGLPLLAATTAAELRLPYVAIEVSEADPPLRVAFGAAPAGAGVTRLPIAHLGRPLGVLEVAARRRGQSLTAGDLALLQEVAREVGAVLDAIGLSASLQVARERLVIAREEERRRIRNDLHDGLAPTLASLQVQLGVVRALIEKDPVQADALIDNMRTDLRAATAAIRQLVYDLRPPLLDELGLVGAMRNIRLNGAALRFSVAAPDAMPRLPAAVEVAAYRIASEAVHNVVTHAQAGTCTVTLDVEDARLTIAVCDDGRGLPADAHPGIGLHSMRERAAELGGTLAIHPRADGGTEVVAVLPITR